MSLQLKEIVNIFKKEKGFERLFSQLFDKYRSYERVEKNITVVLDKPTNDEKRTIGGLIGEDLSRKKVIKITATKLEKAISRTQFGKKNPDLTLEMILQEYYNGVLVSKRKEYEVYTQDRNRFFEYYKSISSSHTFTTLLEWIEGEGNQQNRFYLLYKQDQYLLKKILEILIRVCTKIPLLEPMYLPIFASAITKDPHSFDLDRDEGKFLIYSLKILKNIQGGSTISFETNAEDTTELLYEFGILRDDLLNYATVFNVIGVNHNGQENLLLKGARQEGASFHMPLREVMNVRELKSVSKENIIYMIENSAVSAHIIGKAIQTQNNVSIISGNGQLKLATLRLLDKFIEHGGVIRYAGDFDPEGLGIAQKLLNRYDGKVIMWNFGIEQYLKSLSDKRLEPRRLKQLNQISCPALMEVKEEMLRIKKAGYQENILEDILDNIKPGFESIFWTQKS